jgi:flavodoxin/ferredoxin
MFKSLIVYFTQGGATARVAEAIATGLRSKEHQVDLHNMYDGQPPRLDGYGLLGIGLPAYYFRPPFKVMDYLNSLPELAGLPVFVFLLYGTHAGDAGNTVRRALARKRGQEVGYFKARGADYFLGYLKRGFLFSPDHPTFLELDAAQGFGRKVAERVAGEKYIRQEEDKPPSVVYRLERFLSNRRFVKYMYSWFFYVKAKKCTSCGLCMKVCPTGNISENRKGHPIWGRNCLLCLYCEMKCPTEAILSPVSWPLFSPFIAYNVSRAYLDSSIEHARVIQKKGHTQRAE